MKVLPYMPIAWTVYALSSGKDSPAPPVDGSAGMWTVAALLAVIAGCLLLVVARWLFGVACGIVARGIYRRIRSSPCAATGLRGPLWAKLGIGAASAQLLHTLSESPKVESAEAKRQGVLGKKDAQ